MEKHESVIPEWCLEIAEAVVKTYGRDEAMITGAFAGALYSERERCAAIVVKAASSARTGAIAETDERDGPDDGLLLHAALLDQLAASIRRGEA